MSRDYPKKGIRYRSVVTAWRDNPEDPIAVTHHVERIVCVEVAEFPTDTQYKRATAAAQAIMQAVYPMVDSFDVYNTVDEKEHANEVLGYVAGFGAGVDLYDPNPIVAFWQPHDPTKYRGPGALSFEEYLSREKAK